MLTIENPAAPNGQDLIVFRDSFGSSLIPLLAEGFHTITVIDTRYIQPSLLGNYVDFEGKDVLFLYSTGFSIRAPSFRDKKEPVFPMERRAPFIMCSFSPC